MQVFLRRAVVIVVGESRFAVGVNLVSAEVGRYLRGIVVGLRHGDDAAALHEHGQFPERRGVIVEDAAALVRVAAEIVNPLAFGQIDAVAHVVALLVGAGFLVDRRHEQARAVEELVARLRAEGVGVGIVEEHGAYHRLAVHSLAGDAVSVGHQFRLHLQIPAVDARGGFAERFGVFGVAAPAVHVEFHGRERLPLELAHVDGHVLAAEDAVDIRRDVGLARKAGADKRGNVEADIFPVAARLVAAPNACIALRAGPAVERDDKRAGVAAILGHDFAHVGHAVQAKAIACAHPSHVGLEHAHAGIAHFFHNVSLQQGFDTLFGVQVALRPKSDFHALAAGVFAKLFQVLDIAVERGGLSVACAVAVVGQEPAERHVVGEIAVDGGAGGELIVVLLAVEAFLDAAVISLALVVALAVLVEHKTVFGRCPIVAVVSVEMSFVEAKLWQQHGMSGELVEVVEQFHGAVVDHKEHVEVSLGVLQFHLAWLRLTEVVRTRLKSVPHHAVARSGPVERRGRRYAAVNPVVGVFDGDFLPFVGKSAVLHAAAVEVFICPCAEGQFSLGFGDCCRRGFFHYGRVFSGFIYAHQSCVLVKREQHLGRADGHGRGLLADCEGCAEIAAGRLHEYVGRRLCLRIAHVASRIVAEEAEDVVAIKVYEQRMPVGVGDFNGSGIYQFGFGDGI